MDDALYGPAGFYRSPGAPARHFRTAAHASPLWAGAVKELAVRVDDVLGTPDGFTIVEIGAGGGELLTGLAAHAPRRWSLVGVDVAPRPADLPDRVQWSDKAPTGITGLLVAVEWLDVVPVDVAELTDDGVRLVEVADDGEERVGDAPTTADVEWLEQWWPLEAVGDRAEVGRPRDEAWASLVGRLDRGVAVAVDYAADPGRDVAGTLTGYREGRQVVPMPDGSSDITAHVFMQSCAAACAAMVRDADTHLMTQRDALLQLGVTGERPSYAGDAQAYVAALSRASAGGELVDPHGLGSFTWLLQTRGVDVSQLDLMHSVR
jgi:SAM-dependent MidA family methyltransferase